MGFSSTIARRYCTYFRYGEQKFEMTIKKDGVNMDTSKVIWFDEEIIDLDKQYHIHEFIMNSYDEYPNGYEMCINHVIRELYDRCVRINDDHSLAEELLPLDSEEDYDYYDFDTIKEIVEKLEPLIGDEEILFYYFFA